MDEDTLGPLMGTLIGVALALTYGPFILDWLF
jgi:hypothetical protein